MHIVRHRVRCPAEDSLYTTVAGHRGTAPLLVRSGVSGLQVTYATNEKVLFQELIAVMRRCVCVATGLVRTAPLHTAQKHIWGHEMLTRVTTVRVRQSGK